MTEPELLAWAAEEAAQRKTDLAGPMSMFKLHEAKTRATARRKLVGLTRSQVTLAISNVQALARQRARREQALEAAKAKERAEWPAVNRRRGELIELSISGIMSDAEQFELDKLQAYASDYLERVAPRPTQVLDALEELLAKERARGDFDVVVDQAGARIERES